MKVTTPGTSDITTIKTKSLNLLFTVDVTASTAYVRTVLFFLFFYHTEMHAAILSATELYCKCRKKDYNLLCVHK